MITAADCQQLIKLNKGLLRIDLAPAASRTFLGQILDLLDKELGFTTTMMASLSASGVKELSPNLEAHGLDFSFVQKFLTSCWEQQELPLQEDIIVLSRLPDYKKLALYTELLKPEHFQDLAVQFIRAPGSRRYLSYLVYVSRRQLSDADVEKLQLLEESVALAHLNNIHIWDLRTRVNMLVDNLNYYPLGIMYIADVNRVLHINEIARRYLEDLGITDSRLYSTFYINKIYPHYMHHMRSHKAALPISVGNYLFNVVPASRSDFCLAPEIFGDAINGAMAHDELLSSINDISAYVYIISRGEHQLRFSPSYLANLGLTRREQELVELLAQGRSNKELAALLVISENTVKTHVANIYKKLGINYRAELMDLLYKAHGLGDA